MFSNQRHNFLNNNISISCVPDNVRLNDEIFLVESSTYLRIISIQIFYLDILRGVMSFSLGSESSSSSCAPNS